MFNVLDKVNMNHLEGDKRRIR